MSLFTRRSLAVGAALVLVGAGAGCAARSAAASGPTVVCSDNPCVIQATNAGSGDAFDGLVVQGAAGVNHALIVTDQNGAPILWTNPNSVSTGDLPVVATAPDLSPRAAIYPGTWNAAAGQYQGPGYVELWPSSTGAPVILTIQDIKYLHALEARATTTRRVRA